MEHADPCDCTDVRGEECIRVDNDLAALLDKAEKLRELAALECATSSELRRLVTLLPPPPLLAAARIAQELTALLGPGPVGRVRALIESADRACELEMQRDVMCDKE